VGDVPLSLALDNIEFGTLVVDADGMVTFYSKSYERFLGIPRAQVLGRHVTEVIENTRMHIVAQSGEPEIGWKQKIRGQNMVVQRIPIRDDSGKIIGAVGQVMFRDVAEITELAQKLNLLESKLEYYERELEHLRSSKYTFDHIIGTSPAIEEAKRLALKAAEGSSTVLLLGESGVGKELFAHAIHHGSPRRSKAFVRVNCSSIPRELMESELFGYEAGAFTGAGRRGKPGKFEMANQGSIFLDEVGDMPLEMQAKLLRVLQEKEVERVGGTKTLGVDFRLIAATNADPEELVKAGRLRRDLFYRLNVVPVHIPPLRERREDIPAISRHLLSRIREEQGLGRLGISAEVLALFQRYEWPGNIRELTNVLERASYAADGPQIEMEHLPLFLQDIRGARAGERQRSNLRQAVREAEREAVLQALKMAKGNKAKAAKLLGIHRTGLYQKLGRLKLTGKGHAAHDTGM
jgi:transcriptional regulator with PAS, ATPase and Fis domain